MKEYGLDPRVVGNYYKRFHLEVTYQDLSWKVTWAMLRRKDLSEARADAEWPIRSLFQYYYPTNTIFQVTSDCGMV